MLLNISNNFEACGSFMKLFFDVFTIEDCNLTASWLALSLYEGVVTKTDQINCWTSFQEKGGARNMKKGGDQRPIKMEIRWASEGCVSSGMLLVWRSQAELSLTMYCKWQVLKKIWCKKSAHGWHEGCSKELDSFQLIQLFEFCIRLKYEMKTEWMMTSKCP